MNVALGIDVGGTFTDAVALTPGGMATAKVLTTPNQEEGVLRAAREVLARVGIAPEAVDMFVHGSTVATNALLERRLAKTAFVTTEGFRDLLWLGRQARPHLYRLADAPPEPVVPRSRCFEVSERVGPDGVIRALDEASVVRVADRLEKLAVEAVAICLLFSFLDPSHERRVAELLRERLPDAAVIASHEVAAEVREYERATTVSVDAALAPPTGRYLNRLSDKVVAEGLPSPLVMLSSGGVADIEQAARHPATMLLSGPAGGAVAARLIADPERDLPALGFDMGGTSCDTFMLEADGEAQLTVDRRVAGLPIRLPMVDIHTVSAGGGSIAWVDDGGALRVGPHSAGATPGPACYGRGGRRPTVTDANLLLGYLPADEPLASGLQLDRQAAEAALGRLAKAAGYGSSVEAAEGVVQVAVNQLVQALRVVSVERGHDPAGATLIAFGGAGPLHACALADHLGARRVVCLGASGVLSALGLAAAEQRTDFARTLLQPLLGLDVATLTRSIDEMVGAVNGHELRCTVDLRYAGQSFELMVPFALGEEPIVLEERFHSEHQRRFGHAAPGRPVELVTLRATLARPGFPVRITDGRRVSEAAVQQREIRLDERVVNASVYHADALRTGLRIESPAVVQYPETTCLIPPGWSGRVDHRGLLRLEAAR
jgi:N-methylhydantoinase A